MVDLRLLGISAEEAERLREWKKEPVADRWVFEQVRSDLDRVIGSLPRSVAESAFWQSAEGQFFAELLWDSCPEEDKLPTSNALEYCWGGAEDRKDWLRKYMRLNRAADNGKVHAFRLPERDLVRRKRSAKGAGRWYDRQELDLLRENG